MTMFDLLRREGSMFNLIQAKISLQGVSGLESDGAGQFFCGGGSSGTVRAVRRPRRDSADGSNTGVSVDSVSE